MKCMSCGMPLVPCQDSEGLICVNPECPSGKLGVAFGYALPQPPRKYPTIQDRIRRKISKR